jgi:hypothetical protein
MADALEVLISAYCDAWDEAEPGRRAVMLSAVWADDGVYVDPTVVAKGVAELSAHIGRVLERNPKTRIRRTSKADVHHGLLRFSFARVGRDGSVLREGVDFGEVSGDGKLVRITGFFGPLTPL